MLPSEPHPLKTCESDPATAVVTLALVPWALPARVTLAGEAEVSRETGLLSTGKMTSGPANRAREEETKGFLSKETQVLEEKSQGDNAYLI